MLVGMRIVSHRNTEFFCVLIGFFTGLIILLYKCALDSINFFQANIESGRS